LLILWRVASRASIEQVFIKRWPITQFNMRGPSLGKDSVARCHQVTKVDRSKLTQRIGELNSRELGQIEAGLKAAMDLQ